MANENIPKPQLSNKSIETSVVSYLVSRGSRDLLVAARQEETHEIWPRILSKYESYVSSLVVSESEFGNADAALKRLDAIKPFPVLKITDEAQRLAASLLQGKAIPPEYPEDAMHIALAAVHGIDIIVTWNFCHINNPFKKQIVRHVIEGEGYECPEICSPGDLLEAEE